VKIDVEGAEKSVLKGLDLKKIRPWIILVESTFPTSQIESFKEWEFILLGADYEFVYFDGLNRFYVAKEHQEIGKTLAIPPNVFDSFVLSDTNSRLLRNQIELFQASKSSTQQLHQLLDSTQKETSNLHQQLNTLIEKTITKAISEMECIHNKQEELQVQFRTSLAESTQRETLLRNKEEELLVQIRSMLVESTQREALLRGKEKELQTLQAEIKISSQKVIEKEKIITRLDNEWEATKHTIQELKQSNHKWFLQSERLEKQLNDVFNSYSWRITLPLRKLLQLFLWLISITARFMAWLTCPLKTLTHWLLNKANSFVLKRPKLQVRAQVWLDQHPKIAARLRNLRQADGSLDQPQNSTAGAPQPKPIPQPKSIGTDNDNSILISESLSLSPSARRIYHALKASINERLEDAK